MSGNWQYISRLGSNVGLGNIHCLLPKAVLLSQHYPAVIGIFGTASEISVQKSEASASEASDRESLECPLGMSYSPMWRILHV